jgi:hypothetical protein
VCSRGAIRVEDTILITSGSHVVLTEACPKEVGEVLALMKEERGILQ